MAGLTNGTSYTFALTATNTGGTTSAPLPASTIVIPSASSSLSPAQDFKALTVGNLSSGATPAPKAVASAEQGFSDHEILIGMSSSFTGSAADADTMIYEGMSAYFAQINAQGGVNGRQLRLKVYDDGYDPQRAAANTLRLVTQDHVFAITGEYGTPTVTAVMPLLEALADQNTFMLFPVSGAAVTRTGRYADLSYNLRASYGQEVKGLVKRLLALHRTRIAVFYQNDAYGRDGWAKAREALARSKLRIVAEATYTRGGKFEDSMAEQVAALKEGAPDAIIAIGVTASGAALIRDVRDAGLTCPIATVSLEIFDDMLRLLADAGRARGKSYSENLIGSSVMPNPLHSDLPAAVEYRTLMDKYHPVVHGPLTRTAHPTQAYNELGLEGFLNAKLLVELLRRLGDHPARAYLPVVFEQISNLDLGLGMPVSFSDQRHQGQDSIFYQTAQDGKPVAINDWSTWQK